MDPVLKAMVRALHRRRCPHVDAGNPDACSFVPDKPNWTFQIEDARAAISAIEAAGFKIVGPEPTGEMIDAGAATFCLPHTFSARIENLEPSLADFLIAAIDGQPSRAWRAMWTAAPPRPVEA